MNEFATYDGSAHKLLSDNRAAYFAQSAATRDGKRADFSSPRTLQESAIPSDGVRGSFYPEARL